MLDQASIMDTKMTATLSLPQGADGLMFTTPGDNIKSLLYNVNVRVVTMTLSFAGNNELRTLFLEEIT